MKLKLQLTINFSLFQKYSYFCIQKKEIYMRFSENIINDVCLIKVDLEQASIIHSVEFKKFLFNCIDNGQKKIIVDLSTCKQTDSTFMGTLVAGKKHSETTGGEIALVITAEIVSAMFVISRMDKVFNIFDSVEAGLQHYAKS